ncbi:phytanoyl-CoA dioxygenase family protein, partial [Paenibacillus sepulcri]|nr:phytanoyl-CoA dioxygenase family protein [Paenibacillus sepulcri]
MVSKANEHLLDARQMARFCSDGLLVLEDLVPQELNEAVYRDELTVEPQGYEFWNSSEAIREVFELPQVRGVIESLVGRNYVYDHSFLHTVKPNNSKSQNWHVDSGVMNPNPHNFDIQAFYFAHDTPVEMGPTLVLPGSQLRRASYWSISRYKNIAGQRHLA